VEIALAHFEGDSEEGEILLRAPMLMRCYRDRNDGRVIGPDGSRTWFATGDAGHVDQDGTLAVRGRVAEVIVTGGEMVWPDAVEQILVAHEGVVEVAVWKRPDPEWGERVVAWVVPSRSQPTSEELVDLVKTALSPWAAPKEIVFTTTLPRTASGKVRRSDLR
jgi:acyl-CoA synthetase (AMP-forming)/AMP-acid ligase II